MAQTITGRAAIEYARAHGMSGVNKYADPIEGYRTVTLDEAEAILREDPSLIFVEVEVR